MLIKNAVDHFLDFHRGYVNISLHIIGFAGIFYSIYKLDWILFTIFLIVVEVGHIFNHIVAIKKYDFRFKVIIWRILIFNTVIAVFYFASKLF